MKELGITSGCNTGMEFCPDREVSHGELAVFSYRQDKSSYRMTSTIQFHRPPRVRSTCSGTCPVRILSAPTSARCSINSEPRPSLQSVPQASAPISSSLTTGSIGMVSVPAVERRPFIWLEGSWMSTIPSSSQPAAGPWDR